MRRSSLLALREAPPGLPPRKPLPAPGLPIGSPVALPAGLLGCVWCGSVARGSSSAMHTSSAWGAKGLYLIALNAVTAASHAC